MIFTYPDNYITLQGYRQRGTYIATQVPMENTVNDFWKMIWEYKSTTIVLLCKMTEEGEVTKLAPRVSYPGILIKI